MRMNEDPNWEPGDPLWLDGVVKPADGLEFRRGGYANYLFNFRDDSDSPEPGPDAARWPEPAPGRALPKGDEIESLIEAVRRDREGDGEVA